MKYFMGIDVGTQSTKTLVVDTAGNVIAAAQREYGILKEKLKYAEQDVEILWDAVKETIREITGTHPGIADKISGIGFSGQQHGLVALDKNGIPVRNAIIWCDQRSSRQVAEIHKILTREKLNQIILNELSTGFLLSSLLWVKENEPGNYEKIEKVIVPKDYIRYKMCGEIAMEYSDASGTLIYDTANNVWAWELIDKLGLDREMFPECHESAEIAGKVTDRCAVETGLKKGTPVVYGGGDSIMQQVGNGVIDEKSPWIANIGTSCSLNCASSKPVYDALYRVNTFSHTRDHVWMIMGAGLCGGIVLKWLRDSIFHKQNYDEMTAQAATISAGSEGLFFLPYLTGSRCPDNDAHAQGIFAGLTLNHTQAHMIRSGMEGIVYNLKDAFVIFEEMGLSTDLIIASGGGARGDLFLQIEADMFDREVKVTKGNEQSCIGAAIAAAVGTGMYASYQEACEHMISYQNKIVEPIQENVKIYQEEYQMYREIYENNRVWFHRKENWS